MIYTPDISLSMKRARMSNWAFKDTSSFGPLFLHPSNNLDCNINLYDIGKGDRSMLNKKMPLSYQIVAKVFNFIKEQEPPRLNQAMISVSVTPTTFLNTEAEVSLSGSGAITNTLAILVFLPKHWRPVRIK